ncbi:MAG: pyridoxine 5'-phosphate synthase [Oligoflexales bacterium]|nr:pyridoxine 5'-phosphate synthase [Oligoflexales bacterium]
MIRLGVNLDHIATLRQARLETYPDPVQAAIFAELGGADNITCHLREDRRHIQDRDVKLLQETINIPLNFEMACTAEMLDLATQLKPSAVTLVPEKREELTTEGGLNVISMKESLQKAINQLKENKILVSLFVEASKPVMDVCKELGADAVEIHTGDFCQKLLSAHTSKSQFELVEEFQTVSKHASELGMQVHFGHGLNYRNAYWMQLIPEAEEANIGHAIVARAVFVGLSQAVKEMKDLLNNADHKPNWI